MDARRPIEPRIIDPEMHGSAMRQGQAHGQMHSQGQMSNQGIAMNNSGGVAGLNMTGAGNAMMSEGLVTGDDKIAEPQAGFMDMIYNNKWVVITIVALVLMIFIIMWFWPSKKSVPVMPSQEQPPPLPPNVKPPQMQAMQPQQQQPVQSMQSQQQPQQQPVQSMQSQPQPVQASQQSSQQQVQTMQSQPQSQQVPTQAKSETERKRESLQNILDTAASSVHGVKADSELANLMADEPEEQKVTVVDDLNTVVEMTNNSAESEEDRELRNLLNQVM